MSTEKKPWSAEDLYELQLITDLQISPDGQRVAYTLQRVEKASEKKYSNIWLVETAAESTPRQFTYGDQVDSTPRWSPDGQTIAFTSNRADGKQSYLHLIPLNGGEARPLTKELKGQIGSFEWSPDGSKLLLQFRQTDAEVLERQEDEQKKKLGVVAHHITEMGYKFDGGGYTPKEKWHLWLVDVESAETTQLTEGSYHELGPTWSPGGENILFLSDRTDNPLGGIFSDELALYTIPAAGGDLTHIPTHNGRMTGSARYSPDGSQIAYLGTPEKKGKWWQNTELYVIPAAGGDAQNLSHEYDVDITSTTLGDFGSPPPFSGLQWANNGQAIYTNISRYGGDHIVKFSLAGEMTYIVSDDYVNGNFSMDNEQTKVAFFHAETFDPCQIRLKEFETNETRTLTAVNKPLLDARQFGEVEEVWTKGSDGYDIHGWILTPPNFDPEQTYPSILEIHGGPQTQYGRTFMHEFHYLAAQGYVVYYSNPRGGQGYGNGHAGAIYSQWGTVDYADLIAWTDYVAEQPYIDTERMGITGGSYGGYMTTLIIGRTDRFKAAAPQRLVSNWISFHASSDMNWRAKYLVGLEGEPWNDLENYWKMSPISTIGNVVTPTLVIHSLSDLRCDVEQGEQVYVALKMRGIDTEMVLFPDEGHGLSRGGRTDRRIERLHHIGRWMDKYLQPAEIEADAETPESPTEPKS